MNTKVFRVESPNVQELNGRFPGRTREWLKAYVNLFATDLDEMNAVVEVYASDRFAVFTVDEETEFDMESGEISFSSSGVQYRMTFERATELPSNPSSDTMQKDQ